MPFRKMYQSIFMEIKKADCFLCSTLCEISIKFVCLEYRKPGQNVPQLIFANDTHRHVVETRHILSHGHHLVILRNIQM